jgi:hypothetical protein
VTLIYSAPEITSDWVSWSDPTAAVLTPRDSVPGGAVAVSGDILADTPAEGGATDAWWRSQRWYPAPFNAQDAPLQRTTWPQVPAVKKPSSE